MQRSSRQPAKLRELWTCPKERIDGAEAYRHDRTMWETVDPEERRVVLTFVAWRHIVDEHGELEVYRAAVLKAVRQPDRRTVGRSPAEEWFYLATVRPTRWIKVVVHYEGREGRIVTACPRRRFP